MHHEVEAFEEVAYCYDGSLEGLLCAIFEAYALKEHPTDVWPAASAEPRLLQRTHDVRTDMVVAERVRRGIIRKCGYRGFSAVKKASLSSDPGAASAAYRFVRYAMDEHTGRARPLSNLSHPAVEPLVRVCRSVDNECEHMRQFVRFEHIGGEVDFWFSKINPKHAVIPLIMDHFVERFSIQPFIIYDEVHLMCGAYDGTGWKLMIMDDPSSMEALIPAPSLEERTMQEAWKRFYDTVAIDERYNPELRRHFMPKRLWSNILEVADEKR